MKTGECVLYRTSFRSYLGVIGLWKGAGLPAARQRKMGHPLQRGSFTARCVRVRNKVQSKRNAVIRLTHSNKPTECVRKRSTRPSSSSPVCWAQSKHTNNNKQPSYYRSSVEVNCTLLGWSKQSCFIDKVLRRVSFQRMYENHPSIILIWYIMTSSTSLFTVRRIHYCYRCWNLARKYLGFQNKNSQKQQTGDWYCRYGILECHKTLE